MLEGPQPSTSFVLCLLTMHELQNHNASIGQLYEHTYPPFVFCQVLFYYLCLHRFDQVFKVNCCQGFLKKELYYSVASFITFNDMACIKPDSLSLWHCVVPYKETQTNNTIYNGHVQKSRSKSTQIAPLGLNEKTFFF